MLESCAASSQKKWKQFLYTFDFIDIFFFSFHFNGIEAFVLLWGRREDDVKMVMRVTINGSLF